MDRTDFEKKISAYTTNLDQLKNSILYILDVTYKKEGKILNLSGTYKHHTNEELWLRRGKDVVCLPWDLIETVCFCATGTA